jgi:hypothetical protein
MEQIVTVVIAEVVAALVGALLLAAVRWMFGERLPI